MNRAAKGAVALAAAALCGAAVAIAVRGTPAPAAPNPPSVGTADIVRTDLTSSVLTEGTLGYTASPPVVNELGGTYTSVLAPGSVLQPGQTLFRVDNQPVVLMSGSVPAWRPFAPGMADGPDVQELEASLIALGHARGLLTVAGPHYGAAAVAAVERWQTALGEPATGSIDLGSVVFLPTAVRIDTATVAPGQPAAAGDMPYQVTTTTRRRVRAADAQRPDGCDRSAGLDSASLGCHHARPGHLRRPAADVLVLVVFVLVVFVLVLRVHRVDGAHGDPGRPRGHRCR